eukprot:1538274-Amphidinium_carterae.1
MEHSHQQEWRIRSPNNKCEGVDQQLPQSTHQATNKNDSNRDGEHVGQQHTSTAVTIPDAAGHQHIKPERIAKTGQLHQQP